MYFSFLLLHCDMYIDTPANTLISEQCYLALAYLKASIIHIAFVKIKTMLILVIFYSELPHVGSSSPDNDIGWQEICFFSLFGEKNMVHRAWT